MKRMLLGIVGALVLGADAPKPVFFFHGKPLAD